MRKFGVGDSVCLIVDREGVALDVVKVVEEHVHRTLEGERTVHVVESYVDGRRSKLEDLDTRGFPTLETARDELVRQATGAIDGLVGEVRARTEKFDLFREKEISQQGVTSTNGD